MNAGMNTVTRFRRALNFERVDRLPMLEWASWWNLTMDRWKTEGLIIAPRAGFSEGEALKLQLGLDLDVQYWIGIKSRATPAPAHNGAPLASNEAEYEALLPTLYTGAVDRARLLRMRDLQAAGEAVTWITLIGFFWGPREILGIENHLYAFYDEPELMHRINRDILAYNLKVLDEVFRVFTPDFMTFAEDMSYNNGPMLSESMFDEFILPYYEQIVPALKARGVRVFVDSDGDITKALPWFKRAGIEGILPLERQAGVDVFTLRKAHPDFLFLGHFDKMTMPKGEDAMRAEFSRLYPAMRAGGFIPSVDHQTPPGVSLNNYYTYLRLFREYAERAAD